VRDFVSGWVGPIGLGGKKVTQPALRANMGGRINLISR
jgi:hypothetical protein